MRILCHCWDGCSWVVVGLVGLLVGCGQRADSEVFPSVHEYLPVDVGNVWVYQVDSVGYSGEPGRVPDTVRFLVRWEVVERWRDPAGRWVYRVDRWRKGLNQAQWVPINSFFWIVESGRILRQEENVRWVELVFPVRVGLVWMPFLYYAPADDPTNLYVQWLDRLAQSEWYYRRVGFVCDGDWECVEVWGLGQDLLLEQDTLWRWYGLGVGLVRERVVFRLRDSLSVGFHRGFAVWRRLVSATIVSSSSSS